MKRVVLALLTSVAVSAFFFACAAKKKEPEAKPAEAKTETNKVNVNPANEVAVIKTSQGEMVVEFWPEVAPKTVENFKTLAKKGFYDGTAFHRVITGFMIQGGDPLTKDPTMEARWGQGDPGYKIKAEFNARKHVRGVLSMARSSNPDSAGSQFFICHGTASSLDGQYTTFGKLIKGEEVLDKIANCAKRPGGEGSKPVDRQGVDSVKIVDRETIK